MKKMIFAILLAFGFSAHAHVAFKPYFPAICSVRDLKAVNIHNATAEIIHDEIKISFDLELLECQGKSGKGFVSYKPVDGEHILIYAFESNEMPAIKVPLSADLARGSFYAVNFTVPTNTFKTAQKDFRLDIFLMKNLIPIKMTLGQNGEILFAGFN